MARILYPRLFQPPALVSVAPPTVSADCWFQLPVQPTITRRILYQRQFAPVFVPTAAPEIVTMDKWYQPPVLPKIPVEIIPY